MWSIIILCSVILIGCETSSGNGIPPQIRPAKIDLNGVSGFAIVENSSNAAETRAGGEESSCSHLLYTIDENGELHISIFYFEVVPSEGGDTENPQTEVMKEVSKALQVVPSLVSDLGKYILFSGCRYEMNDIIMSDEARAICEEYTQYNSEQNMTYLIRKSDGALFYLDYAPIFTYSNMTAAYDNGMFDGYHYMGFISQYYNDPRSIGWSMPNYRYLTSPKGNLFTLACYNDRVYQIVDNGNAIDVKLMTQDYETDGLSRFIVDANENIYIYNECRGYLDIYLSNGRFDAIDMRYYSRPNDAGSLTVPRIFDMKYDDNNIAYSFFDSTYYDYDNDVSVTYITASILSDGNYIERNKIAIPLYTTYPYLHPENPLTYPHYIGYSNGNFKWFLSENFFEPHYSSNLGDDRIFKTLTYNKDRDEWILEDIPEDLRNIYTEKYDHLLYGIKSYGINVKGNTIEINEIDMVNNSYRQYSFNVDISFIKSQSYMATMLNETPYLFITGKSSESGADVSFMINLANGENNSTFATDNRNVVSFFRIN